MWVLRGNGKTARGHMQVKDGMYTYLRNSETLNPAGIIAAFTLNNHSK